MYICILCEKIFNEIPEDATPLPSIGRRQLYRFQGGLVHDIKPYNGPAVPIGATVQKPKPVVPEAVPESIPEPQIEQTQEPVPEVQESTEAFSEAIRADEFELEDLVGCRINGVVVSFHTEPVKTGFVRLLPHREGRKGLYFRFSDVSSGLDQIAVGTKVVCTVTENYPEYPNTFRAIDVEVEEVFEN